VGLRAEHDPRAAERRHNRKSALTYVAAPRLNVPIAGLFSHRSRVGYVIFAAPRLFRFRK
jgi:hypothetical protein